MIKLPDDPKVRVACFVLPYLMPADVMFAGPSGFGMGEDEDENESWRGPAPRSSISIPGDPEDIVKLRKKACQVLFDYLSRETVEPMTDA